MTLDELRLILASPLPDDARLEFRVGDLRGVMSSDPTTAIEPKSADDGEDKMLTADDVAAMLNLKTSWVYDHAAQLGGKKLSRKCVRFSLRAVQRYLNRRVRS